MKNYRTRGAAKPVIGAAICGLLAVFMVFLAIKAFAQYDEMAPLRKDSVVVADAKVLPENEGMLVLVSGRVTYEGGMVSDEDFDVTVEAPYLTRNVDMRQWVNSRSHGSNSGVAEARFLSTLQPDEKIGDKWYSNPGSMPFEGAVFYSGTKVKLGEFELSEALTQKLMGLPNRTTEVTGLSQRGADANGMTLDDVNHLYYYESDFGWGVAGAQGIGDTRVYFYAADPEKLGEITVMAQQQDGMLTEYHEGVSYIELIYDGIVDKDEILGTEETGDSYGAITAVVLVVLFAVLTALNIRKIVKIKRENEKIANQGYSEA